MHVVKLSSLRFAMCARSITAYIKLTNFLGGEIIKNWTVRMTITGCPKKNVLLKF